MRQSIACALTWDVLAPSYDIFMLWAPLKVFLVLAVPIVLICLFTIRLIYSKYSNYILYIRSKRYGYHTKTFHAKVDCLFLSLRWIAVAGLFLFLKTRRHMWLDQPVILAKDLPVGLAILCRVCGRLRDNVPHSLTLM